MICKYCGAEYPDTQEKCSYCKSENQQVAEQKFKSKVTDLHEQANEIRKLPEKIVKKSRKVLIVTGLILIGLVIAGSLLAVIIGKYSEEKKYQKIQENLAKLQVLYEKKEYYQLNTYMKDQHLYEDSYNFYFQVGDVYYYYKRMLERESDLKQSEGLGEELIKDWMELVFEYAGEVMSLCNEYTKDSAALGNEDVLAEAYELVKEKLINTYQLTPEEIEEFSTLEEYNQDTVRPFINLSYERIYK